MRWILPIFLVALWGVLFLTLHAAGGLIHVILAAAGAVLLVQLIFRHRDQPGNLKTMTIEESRLATPSKEDR